jgi:hypothetical protein
MIEIKKSRKDDLIFTVLEIVKDPINLIERESHHQKKFNVVESSDYWNIKYANGWNSYMIGRSHSRETRDKIGAGNKDKVMPLFAIETLRTKNKKAWDDKREAGESYFTEEGMANLIEEGRKVGKLPRDAEWSRKHRERKLGSKNTEESKGKTSRSLKEKYKNSEISNGMSKCVMSISMDGITTQFYKNKTEAAASIGKQRYHINQAIKEKIPLCNFFWSDVK